MKFKVILADPPWRFKNWSMEDRAKLGEKWGRANGRPIYDTLNTDTIAQLPVADVADKDCVLFLWATMPQLEDALRVMAGWGFTYKTCAFTWAKQNVSGNGWFFGLGYWTHGNAELCLLGTRGKPKRVDKCVSSLVVTPRGRHSAKPKEVHARIEALMGDVPRLEMFARETMPGWVCVGNEITGRDIREDLRLLEKSSTCSTWQETCTILSSNQSSGCLHPDHGEHSCGRCPGCCGAEEYCCSLSSGNSIEEGELDMARSVRSAAPEAPAAPPVQQAPVADYVLLPVPQQQFVPPVAPPVQQVPQYPAQQPQYPVQQALNRPQPVDYAPQGPPFLEAPIQQAPIQQPQQDLSGNGHHLQQPLNTLPLNTAPRGNSPLHAFDMDGVGDFQLLPEERPIELEIVKATLTTIKSGNNAGQPQIQLQLKVTFPEQFARVTVYDNINLIESMMWRYKSLCRVCEDADGNPLLSKDARFFTGRDEQDFVGNVVRSKVKQGVSNNGNPRNDLTGGFSAAFETPGLTSVEEASTPSQPVGAAPSTVPPQYPQLGPPQVPVSGAVSWK